MKKILSFFFICVIVASFSSCERATEITKPATTTTEEPAVVESDSTAVDDDTTTPPVQPSPIKGLWEYKVSGLQMTLDFGDTKVEYKCHTDLIEATATYKGTYTIEDNDITLEFYSLTSTSSKVNFYAPEDLQKNAILKDENTIVYIDKEYKRNN